MNSPGRSIAACPATTVDAEKVRAQLDRVLASRSFAAAKSARRFLRYVVEETLAGNGDQIKEYVVGVSVFDRGDGFDPRADAVVRVEATRLRNRLRDYYQNEGRADHISIELPKGSYVPVFQSLPDLAQAQHPPRFRRNSTKLWASICIGVLLTLCVLWWGRWRKPSRGEVGSLAVLPFENLSGDGSQDYLAYAVTEDLIADLGGVGRLRVISHPSVIRYQGTAKPRREIARELKVDAFIEGSVMRTGNRVRLSARLVHASSLRQLWAQSYEREVSDIPTWRREAARTIAAAIGAEPPRSLTVLTGDVLRVNPEAYDTYLRGRFHGQHQTREGNEAAILNLERATAIDPNFAAAYAELAQAYVWKLFLFDPKGKQWEEKAFVASERALSIDPESAVAHLARGRLLWTPANHFPHEKAIREYKRALTSDPNLDEARNQLAVIYCHIGYFDQALDESRKAIASNPNNNLAAYRIAQTLAFGGRFEEALSALRQVPEAANPSMIGYQSAWILFNLGRRREAAAKVAQLLREDPQDSGGLFTGVQAVLAAAEGDEATALAKIRQAATKGPGFGHFHHTAYHIATAFALLNRSDEAIRWLEESAGDGFPCYPMFENDHNLDKLRQDPRFVAFMRKLKQQWIGYKPLF